MAHPYRCLHYLGTYNDETTPSPEVPTSLQKTKCPSSEKSSLIFSTRNSGLVRHLQNLRLSPLGVVPQRDRRPRLIVDLSFFGINQESVPIAPSDSMQFGRALHRILQRILQANPLHGPVYISKIDIADGFYRI
ncbi:unnamed protein product [Cylindrotheca closterium]|uniref:Reverse transcriptase domain-containing protein n=1 Tax=Cylindrotheca closterium TaxID=2856 RepID=A0AAD2FI52_9STRA|nr:unnamed protein product [Cylindrotheca closterium]